MGSLHACSKLDWQYPTNLISYLSFGMMRQAVCCLTSIGHLQYVNQTLINLIWLLEENLSPIKEGVHGNLIFLRRRIEPTDIALHNF